MNFGVLALSFCKALLSTGNVLLVAVTALIGLSTLTRPYLVYITCSVPVYWLNVRHDPSIIDHE